MLRTVVLDDYQDAARRFGDWDRLRDRIDLHVRRDHLFDEDEVATALADAEIVVAMRERTAFPATLLRRLPHLRLLVTTGTSNAVVDVAAAHELGITVCGTGGLARPTPELTWALLLALARNICREDASVRAGGWQTTVGVDLAGSRLGVVGLGWAGSRVARIAQAFRMDVVAWSQNMTGEHAESVGARLVSKEELFATADFVTLHVQLSARTRRLVGKDEFATMKPHAYLVNTSRGPVVDTAALVTALHTGAIAGAGLDVFDDEPLPADHPLRSAPNTVLTPHIGYVTESTYELFYKEIVEDIELYLDGRPARLIEP